ncbi:MAG TPA: hypothetical protein VF021_06315 [Longimicrobiales bacterium]
MRCDESTGTRLSSGWCDVDVVAFIVIIMIILTIVTIIKIMTINRH